MKLFTYTYINMYIYTYINPIQYKKITEHDHHDVTNGRYRSCVRYLFSLTLNIINVSKYSKYCVTGIIIHSLLFTNDLETNIEMVG